MSSILEPLLGLLRFGNERLLILLTVLLCLFATVPRSHLVMCYFDRISGR